MLMTNVATAVTTGSEQPEGHKTAGGSLQAQVDKIFCHSNSGARRSNPTPWSYDKSEGFALSTAGPCAGGPAAGSSCCHRHRSTEEGGGRWAGPGSMPACMICNAEDVVSAPPHTMTLCPSYSAFDLPLDMRTMAATYDDLRDAAHEDCVPCPHLGLGAEKDSHLII